LWLTLRVSLTAEGSDAVLPARADPRHERRRASQLVGTADAATQGRPVGGRTTVCRRPQRKSLTTTLRLHRRQLVILVLT